MYKLCKSEQSAARQRELEQKFLEAMLVQRYEDISISDFCEQLHIPRKCFYRYFSSKDGILFALLDHTMLQFYEDRQKRAITTKPEELRLFFTFWHQHRDLLEALEKSSMSGMLIERATLLAQQEQLMPYKALLWPIDIQAMAMSFTISGLMSLLFQWHHQNYQTSDEELAKLVILMLSKPLLGNMNY